MRVRTEDRAVWRHAAFVVVAALLLTQAFLNGSEYWERLDSPQNGQDFAAYYVPAAMFLDGHTDIYTPAAVQQYGTDLGLYPDRVWTQPYLYPPIVAQALMPLALLPYATARLLWFLVSVTALLGALAAVLRVTPPGLRRWVALLWLTLPHHVVSLYMGQADSIVTALLALGAVALEQQRGRWMGGLAAVAGAVKVSPVLVAAPLLWRREGRWRILRGLLTTGILVLTTSVLIGAAQGAPLLWMTYLTELPELGGMTRDWVENVSVSGALRRFFLQGPLPLTLPQTSSILTAVHVLLAALLLWWMLPTPPFRPQPARSDGDPQRTVALAVVWLLLIAPITWPSTLSLLVIPATWLLRALAATPTLPRLTVAAPLIGLLWLPNAALPELPLADWSYLRTGALLGLFFVATGLRERSAAARQPASIAAGRWAIDRDGAWRGARLSLLARQTRYEDGAVGRAPDERQAG